MQEFGAKLQLTAWECVDGQPTGCASGICLPQRDACMRGVCGDIHGGGDGGGFFGGGGGLFFGGGGGLFFGGGGSRLGGGWCGGGGLRLGGGPCGGGGFFAGGGELTFNGGGGLRLGGGWCGGGGFLGGGGGLFGGVGLGAAAAVTGTAVPHRPAARRIRRLTTRRSIAPARRRPGTHDCTFGA